MIPSLFWKVKAFSFFVFLTYSLENIEQMSEIKNTFFRILSILRL